MAGRVRRPKDNEKYFALLEIDSVNGMDVEAARVRPNFDKLTLSSRMSASGWRTVLCPWPSESSTWWLQSGRRQRGMVVSPPKAGKTTILKQTPANGIINSSPDTHVIVLLVDERPEEVTDWQRTVEAAEERYSTFDKPADQHIQVTELVLERARRLAEMGQDVRRSRRLRHPSGARLQSGGARLRQEILSGGVDSTAL